VAVIYFFAGVAKLNADWLTGSPWQGWLEVRRTQPFVAFLLEYDLGYLAFGIGAPLFDLLVIPALLWRRTRWPAFIAAAAFHFVNGGLFSIGIFPLMMVVATTLFFSPDWPSRLLSWMTERAPGVRDPPTTSLTPRYLVVLLALFVGLQIVLPIRHLAYPGSVAWTDRGHKFAWRMMLTDKIASGEFVLHDREGSRVVSPEDYLEPWQTRVMVTRPDMIVQFAKFVARKATSDPTARVTANLVMSLNGRPYQQFVRPSCDLASTSRSSLECFTTRPPARVTESIVEEGGM